MTFSKLMAFWELNGKIVHHSCMTRNLEHDSTHHHATYSMIVESDNHMKAQIFYKCTENGFSKSNLAMIYSDILFEGMFGEVDKVFIKGARVASLAEHLT